MSRPSIRVPPLTETVKLSYFRALGSGFKSQGRNRRCKLLHYLGDSGGLL